MQAIIWKESIYKNDFKCDSCGELLSNENGLPNDNTGFDANPYQPQDILYCCSCKEPVAIIREYEGDLPPGTLCGKWEGDL